MEYRAKARPPSSPPTPASTAPTKNPPSPPCAPSSPSSPTKQSFSRPWTTPPTKRQPSPPPSHVPHLGHALPLPRLHYVLLLALSQLLLLSLYHTTPGRLAATHPQQTPRRLRGPQLPRHPRRLPGSSFPVLWHRPFAQGIQANPSAAIRNALRLIPLGIALSSFIVQARLLIHLPAQVHPHRRLLPHPSDVWIVTAFGILLAPLFEETLFRGFLFPAFAIAYDWLCLPPRTEAARDQWNSSNQISNAAYIFAAVLTSVFFAALHGPQIAFAWPVLLLLFCVSLILTAVRYRLRSVLASTLVHASYNLAIFLTAFIGTGGYRHLERMTR